MQIWKTDGSGVFTINFEQILQIFLVFSLLTLKKYTLAVCVNVKK